MEIQKLLKKEIAEKNIVLRDGDTITLEEGDWREECSSQRCRYNNSWRKRLFMEMNIDLEIEIALGEGDCWEEDISQRWRYSSSLRRRLLMEINIDLEIEIVHAEGDCWEDDISQRLDTYSSSWRRRLLMEIMKDPEMEIALGEGEITHGARGGEDGNGVKRDWHNKGTLTRLQQHTCVK
jgi:hypothetical protein